MHGLQKLSFHLFGHLERNNGATLATGGKGTLDIGNNNSFNLTFALQDVGVGSVSYSGEDGFESSFTKGAGFSTFDNLAFDAKHPGGIKIPDWAAKLGVDAATDSFTPENMEEAFSDDAHFNQAMSFILNSINDLIDSEVLDAYYSYDGTEGEATNEKGESYKRKFTHSYKGKFKDIQFGDDGIRFRGNLIISYTDQECQENCNGNE